MCLSQVILQQMWKLKREMCSLCTSSKCHSLQLPPRLYQARWQKELICTLIPSSLSPTLFRTCFLLIGSGERKDFSRKWVLSTTQVKIPKNGKSPTRTVNIFAKLSRRLARMIRKEGLGSRVIFLRGLPLSKSRVSSEGHF